MTIAVTKNILVWITHQDNAGVNNPNMPRVEDGTGTNNVNMPQIKHGSRPKIIKTRVGKPQAPEAGHCGK